MSYYLLTVTEFFYQVFYRRLFRFTLLRQISAFTTISTAVTITTVATTTAISAITAITDAVMIFGLLLS